MSIEYFEQFIEALALHESIQNKNIIVMGDFNVPSYGIDKYDCRANVLTNFIEMLNLKQFNDVKNLNGRLLDLIFSNIECHVSENEIALSKIDKHHPPLRFTTDCNLVHHEQFKICKNSSNIYNFRKANFPLLYDLILNADFSDLYNSSDINEACEKFYVILNEIFHLTVPFKIDRKRRYPPWYNSKVINLIRQKELAYKKFKRCQTGYYYNIFKGIRSSLKTEIDNAFTTFVLNVENTIQKDSSEFWSFIQSKKGHSRIPGTIRDGSNEFSTPESIVEAFSYFFQSVYTDPSENNVINSEYVTKCYTSLKLLQESDIIRAAKKLKNKITSGNDSIPSFVVKDCIHVLSGPLTHLFNISIKSGCFPNCWKIARIIPIPKKGDPTELRNYRAISILNNFSKLFEICIFEQIYMQVESAISIDQHGFMRKRSCDTNLCCLSQYICSTLDRQGQVDVAYMDFQKAFDQIDHNILLQKLEVMGFSNDILAILKSYLIGRIQYVEIDGFRSSEYVVTSGVPQGSNLGPLLFLLFINDLANSISCPKLLFADDLKLYSTINSSFDCKMLQIQINVVQSWCNMNKLNLNISKCYVVTYCKKKTFLQYEYQIDQFTITRNTAIKDLGVTFDQQFTFKTHYKNIVSSASRTLGFILRNCKSFNNVNTLKLIYNSFVISKLEYCSIVWHPIYQMDISHLESVQRRFIKYLALKQDGFYPIRGIEQSLILNRFKMVALETRRQKQGISFLFKLLNNKIDCTTLLNEILFVIPRINSRNNCTFFCPRPRTNMLTKAPLFYLCNLFNRYCGNCDMFFNSLDNILAQIN